MENTNYKNIDIGYELWKRGYMLKNVGDEPKVYKLYVSLYELAHIESVDDFISYIPDGVIYDYREADRKYKEENEPKIRQYFAEHFEGKTWGEIEPERWEFYSDWHKDVFGYRPHEIVCGEYINPHR